MASEVPCPQCGEPTEADEVDIGVGMQQCGMQQCGPRHCEACGWCEPPLYCRKPGEHWAGGCDCGPALVLEDDKDL